MTAEGIGLRPAVAADGDRIAAIFTAARGLLTFLPNLHSAEEDRGFIRDHVMTTYHVTVAETADGIVGYLAEAPGWVEQLYCDPSQLRRGIGSVLLIDCMERQPVLELWCFEENVRARVFYERHGFVAIERTDGSSLAEKRPDIRYRWLRPAA